MSLRKFAVFTALCAIFASGCVGETAALQQLPGDGDLNSEQSDDGVGNVPDVPNVSGRPDAALVPDVAVPNPKPDAVLDPDAPIQDAAEHEPDAATMPPQDAQAPSEPDLAALLPDAMSPDIDTDGDGTPDKDDCQPENVAVHPGQNEQCNFLDDDCDGQTDEGVLLNFWPDLDNDGYGDRDAVPVMGCIRPVGFVARGGDCNEDDATIYANAPELCDGKDNNCDGVIGDSIQDMHELFRDVDGDGEGNPLDSAFFCGDQDGYVVPGTDCDDADPAVHNGAEEVCNGFDDNCDGAIDEGLALTYLPDGDGDGYGNMHGTPVAACAPPPNHVLRPGDCDDNNGQISPSAVEVCDPFNVDEDCDGLSDNADDSANPDSMSQFYEDLDGDTWGNPDVSLARCDRPEGYVVTNLDCDDALASVSPDGQEVCNGLDDNCDGEVDNDASDMPTWYQDNDLDGAGNPDAVLVTCDQPEGYVSVAGDCDDHDNDIQDHGEEICDQQDNDCDGVIDDGVQTATYADLDLDTYGDPQTELLGCGVPAGRVSDLSDCDDTDPTINPGAREVCDIFNTDEDCNGSADDADGAVAANSLNTFYQDADQDGDGNPNVSERTCDQPEGYVVSHTDCDDENGAINPDAVEVCDNVDNNCDGQTDEGVMLEWYADRDADLCPEGTLDGEITDTTFACERPEGYMLSTDERSCLTDDIDLRGDCNDDDALINPSADELCDGLDNDCDGVVDEDAVDMTTWYQDADGDGAGNPDVTIVSCEHPEGYLDVAGDCDDQDNDIQNNGVEICDGDDNDCNGLVDDGVLLDSYDDLDHDGFGDPQSMTLTCIIPAGRTRDNRDCNDDDALINPSAEELCDTLDNDCDNEIDENVLILSFLDIDHDGFGDPATGAFSCVVARGRTLQARDCNDDNAAINPDATEVCDVADVDENCNGSADDLDPGVDPATRSRFAPDIDQDGFGDFNNVTTVCNQPPRTIANTADCDDRFASVHPGANEVENGIDDNCNGTIDEGTNAFDDDRDGYSENQGDCNDEDATIFPDQRAEVCNGRDDDCDNTVDDHIGTNVFPDVDGDGHGAMVASNVWVCGAPPAGKSALSDDCDDGNANVHPRALELCNGIDDNCILGVDEATADDARIWFQDLDGDTFGNLNVTSRACNQPVNYVASSTDCNDRNDTVSPNGNEICDGLDNDCDTVVDDGVTLPFYQDRDGDREGDVRAVAVNTCIAPAGHVANNDDCNDGNPATNTRGVEVCDTLDNDCDGLVDENLQVLKCRDADNDNFGSAVIACVHGCAQAGYVANALDCDDFNNRVRPGALERCDGFDNDCDGLIDAMDPSVSVLDIESGSIDLDDDFFGQPGTRVVWCEDDPVPVHVAFVDTDCDDDNADVNPDATEVCDAADVDEDCNGLDDDDDPDVDPATLASFATDTDQDGFGDQNNVLEVCNQPPGTVLDHTDCADEFVTVHPGAAEIENTIDDDCDGIVDEGTNAFDDDGDGFSENNGDCNDADRTIFPQQRAEACNGRDDDCDAIIDDGVGTNVFPDVDGDGFGAIVASNLWVCGAVPAGKSASSDDCNDVNANINPRAAELCNGIDDNCVGGVDEGVLIAFFPDRDGDGEGDASIAAVNACAPARGQVENNRDCNDASVAINTRAVEVCDGVDNNCALGIDEGLTVLKCRDADIDGFGSAIIACVQGCAQAGYVPNALDCDDFNNRVRPGALERCDGIDNDCDNLVDAADPSVSVFDIERTFSDNDGDGYGDNNLPVVWCENDDQPADTVFDNSDCDDEDPIVHPNAPEACGIERDFDCDGLFPMQDDCVDEGSYEGDFELNVTAPRLGVPRDTCSGTITFFLELDQEHTILGDVECTYEPGGDFEAAFPDGHTGTITADVFSDLGTFGEIELDGWTSSFLFSGTFEDFGTVFVGQFSIGQNRLDDGTPFNYSGDLSATRL